MPVKKHRVEQIIAKLCEIEKLTGQGMSVPMAARKVVVTDQTLFTDVVRIISAPESGRALAAAPSTTVGGAVASGK